MKENDLKVLLNTIGHLITMLIAGFFGYAYGAHIVPMFVVIIVALLVIWAVVDISNNGQL